MFDYEANQLINKIEWKKFNTMQCECSARTGENVRNIYATAAELVVKQR